MFDPRRQRPLSFLADEFAKGHFFAGSGGEFRRAAGAAALTNWALASKGATTDASSTLVTGDGRNWDPSYAVDGIEDADWPVAGGIWHSAANTIVANNISWSVNFASSKTINTIELVGPRDIVGGHAAAGAVSPSETFTGYALTSFKFQYNNGSGGYIDIPSTDTTGNNHVLCRFTGLNITTIGIRLIGRDSPDGYARAQEIRAFGP